MKKCCQCRSLAGFRCDACAAPYCYDCLGWHWTDEPGHMPREEA